jgi:hypothetical protein
MGYTGILEEVSTEKTKKGSEVPRCLEGKSILS